MSFSDSRSLSLRPLISAMLLEGSTPSPSIDLRASISWRNSNGMKGNKPLRKKWLNCTEAYIGTQRYWLTTAKYISHIPVYITKTGKLAYSVFSLIPSPRLQV